MTTANPNRQVEVEGWKIPLRVVADALHAVERNEGKGTVEQTVVLVLKAVADNLEQVGCQDAPTGVLHEGVAAHGKINCIPVYRWRS